MIKAYYGSRLVRALASRDPAVRSAYFDLAAFYHQKLGRAGAKHPAASMLRELAKESCRETHCWCK